MAERQERLTKEQIEEAKRRLKEEGFDVTEIRPYDKNDPTTDRRKAKDRRKPAEPPKRKGFWD